MYKRINRKLKYGYNLSEREYFYIQTLIQNKIFTFLKGTSLKIEDLSNYLCKIIQPKIDVIDTKCIIDQTNGKIEIDVVIKQPYMQIRLPK